MRNDATSDLKADSASSRLKPGQLPVRLLSSSWLLAGFIAGDAYFLLMSPAIDFVIVDVYSLASSPQLALSDPTIKKLA